MLQSLLKNYLYRAVAPIDVRAVNGDTGSTSLDYDNHKDDGLRVIAVGGNTLSRGLTLEGLMVTYFYRNTNMYDTLMQMGRWFGYRIGYELLPRIWLTSEAEEKFKEVSYIENRLREDLKKYDLGAKPSEYAPKIQSSYLTRFLLTSKNKSQNASKAGATYEKVDNQTVVFDSNPTIQKENKGNAIEFIKELPISGCCSD